MKKVICSLCISLLFAAFSFAQNTPKPPETKLKIGDTAPEFVLNDTTGNVVKLSDFKGKKSVVLAFYILAFTGG